MSTGKFKPKVDEYYKIKLSVRGSDIKVYYDDNLEIETKNKSRKQGAIAVSSQDRVVYFDNIKVGEPDIPNTDMSSVEPEGKLTSIWARIKANNQ